MQIENLERYVLEHPFVKDLDLQWAKLMSGCAKNVVVKNGEFVFREGGEAQEFFLIRQGRVALEAHIPGRGSVVIQTLQEGDVLGWSWLFEPYKWHFDAHALETLRLVSIDGRCVRKKCDANPEMGYQLMRKFAQTVSIRLQETRLRLFDIYGANN
jgi:CRP/FNR family transcriptional regulator, cyclic AMP receptor protein